MSDDEAGAISLLLFGVVMLFAAVLLGGCVTPAGLGGSVSIPSSRPVCFARSEIAAILIARARMRAMLAKERAGRERDRAESQHRVYAITKAAAARLALCEESLSRVPSSCRPAIVPWIVVGVVAAAAIITTIAMGVRP